MPDPKAGVIRSAHPRAVGPNGLVEAKNWILRDGSMQMRDGIRHVVSPAKTLITPGSSWAEGITNKWNTSLTTVPTEVYFNGVRGTRVSSPPNLSAANDWCWAADYLWVYSTSDPDNLVDPGVEWTSDTGGTSVIAMASHDYQGQDDSGIQGSIRDQLIVVLNNDIVCYNSDLSVARSVTETDTDWAWDGFYGPDATSEDEWQQTQKISVDWTNIDWSQFTSGTHGIGIRLEFTFYDAAEVHLELWEHDGTTSTDIDATFILPDGNDDSISHVEYEQGVPYQIADAGDDPTGIYIIFNDTWDSWYDEALASGDDIGSVWLPYCWAVYNASEHGLPGNQSTVMDLDNTQRPVIRTWDYEQITHNLIALEGKFILDVDANSLSAVPDPTVSTSGDTGKCPRAKTIGIASQRIIAGNVSYFNSQLTAETGRTIDEGSLEQDVADVEWADIVDKFAFFPDAVVYSGTVLTDGHKSWFPADILRLADTPGEVVGMQEMGTQMIAVYKTDAIYTLSASTGPSPFAPSLRASGIQGPMSARSIVAISDNTHIYLARDGGVYMFSGQTPTSLGDQFRTWISREIDPDYSDSAFMIFDPERNEIHAYYAVKGSGGVVRKGIVIDVSTQPFTAWPVLWPKQVYDAAEATLADIGFFCATMHYEGEQDVITSDITIPAAEVVASPTTKYQELYLGTENEPLTTGDRSAVENGRIFKTANIGNDHGVAIVASFETGISDLGDPDHQKVILEVELLFDNLANVASATDVSLDVTVYGGDSNKNLSQLWQETDIGIASGQITVHPRVRARYFSVAVEITAAVEPYDADGKDWSQNFGEIEYYGAIVRHKVSGVRQN
jgi:hypothetical protein